MTLTHPVAPQANEKTGKHGPRLVNRAAPVPPPVGKGSYPSKEIYGPSTKRWQPVVLHHILSQLFLLFILLLFSSYISGEPFRAPFLPIRKHPSSVRPYGKSCSLTLNTDSLHPNTEGERTTQPGSDNILFVVFVVFLYILLILTK